MPPQRLKFELLFDATGALPDSPADLAAEIDTFLSVVYDFDGETHQPHFLQIYWGKLSFKARLTDLSLSYSLFSPEGQPLRARADVGFLQFIDSETLQREEAKSSPDMTHVVTVSNGDTLPLLCQRIYRDASYYPQVARANGLTHFRRLQPGTQLVFPPLK
jgi:nucleoid-associated protein YgaU